MKKLFLIILLIISCKTDNKSSKELVEEQNLQIVSKKTIEEIKYVNAESGLNYRDVPKGTKLGKFNFNDKLIIDSHSGVFQKIKDENDSINGEWVSTLVNNKKVFVFSGFLSDTISKSKAEIDNEINALTENKIKKIIEVELNKSSSERIEESKFYEEKYLNALKESRENNGSSIVEYMLLEEKWTKLANEKIKPEKDTVVITDEISLLKNLKSNRVFLIDAPILNFQNIEVIYNEEHHFKVNRHLTDLTSGELLLRNLRNVHFIGRNQRVYFICQRYGESILRIADLEKFMFENISFYYPTNENDRKQQIDNLNQGEHRFYAISIDGGYGKFINCKIDGTGFLGVEIYNSNNIAFENCIFSNIQKSVISLDHSKISLNNVTIKNNDCESIIQLKDNLGYGSHGEEKISIRNSLITNNKSKQLLGFGKSFENKPLLSYVEFNNCEISNNSFQRTFLNFNYKKERNAWFHNCKINNNKIFDINEGDAPFFIKGANKYSATFKNTTFNNNDWKVTIEEREKYFN